MNEIVRNDCIKILERIGAQRLRDRKILLTGSNGLFGSYFVNCIAICIREFGIPVKLQCVSRHGPSANLSDLIDGKNIQGLQLDLATNFSIETDCDLVLHAACYGQPKLWMEDKLKTIDLNVFTTRRLLDIARSRSAGFLFFSSQDVYGELPGTKPVPETYNGSLNPVGERSAYGESKRLGEHICSIFAKEGMQVKIARIGHTYGPGVSINDGRVLGDFIRMALTEKCIRIRDTGQSIKTFGYVGDMVEMLFQLALGAKELVYNVGGRDQMNIAQLAQVVADVVGGVSVEIPKVAERGGHIGTDAPFTGVDIGLFEKEFGQRNFMPFKTGIKQTVDWNRQVHQIAQ